jgi:Cu+-exporting ATPase
VTVEPAAGWSESDLLRLAASLERGSEHPLAAAIVAGASERKVDLAKGEDFQSTTGKGVDGRRVALGNRPMLQEMSVEPSGRAGAFASWRSRA